jgi:hypothetical protein
MPLPKHPFRSKANDSCKKITDLIFNYLTDRLARPSGENSSGI